jgi:hypothetical protein
MQRSPGCGHTQAEPRGAPAVAYSRARPWTMAATPRAQHAACMADLNNAQPTPPPESQDKLAQAEQQSRRLDHPQRTNESTVDPDKPPRDILEGFHGG